MVFPENLDSTLEHLQNVCECSLDILRDSVLNLDSIYMASQQTLLSVLEPGKLMILANFENLTHCLIRT